MSPKIKHVFQRCSHFSGHSVQTKQLQPPEIWKQSNVLIIYIAGPKGSPSGGLPQNASFSIMCLSFCKFSADFDADRMKCVPMTRANITSTGYGSLHACNHPATYPLAHFSPDLCKSMALLGRGDRDNWPAQPATPL